MSAISLAVVGSFNRLACLERVQKGMHMDEAQGDAEGPCMGVEGSICGGRWYQNFRCRSLLAPSYH